MSITSIENLPNELFDEIFVYFNGFEMYRIFSNLNHRFQQLLNSSALRFKLSISQSSNEKYTNKYKCECEQLLQMNHQQIVSLCMSFSLNEHDCFSLYPIHLFVNLESLVLNRISSSKLISVLTDLPCLSRLHSLTIDPCWRSCEITDIYQLLFTLRNLKYFTCSSTEAVTTILLPIATNEQLTPIEHLFIDYLCDFIDLFAIVSYAPQLQYLRVQCLDDEYNHSSPSTLPYSLFNLTHISIDLCDITFDKFKFFIRETECNLKVLRIKIDFHDRAYLDADQWEELISECLPQLEIFHFKCSRYIRRKSDLLTYYKPVHPFMSLFWIEHRWIWEIEMYSCNLLYSIRLYKDRWYDENSSIELSKSTRLKITGYTDYALNLIIRDVLTVAQIYHLEISIYDICLRTLTEIINCLPALDSLKISSLTLFQSRLSSCASTNNKITKVYFEDVNTIEELVLIFKICPCLTYLRVDIMNELDYESFLKKILPRIHTKCNQYLRTICLHLRTTIENELLNKIYNHEKLSHLYTIEQNRNNIYLHRK